MDERGRRAETGHRKTDRGIEREMARIDIILPTTEGKQIDSIEDGRKRKCKFSRWRRLVMQIGAQRAPEIHS